jgi:TatD DNase family protein
MSIRLIDAHSHINFNAYKDDAPEVIARAEGQGIAMLAVGSQITTSERAVDYAEKHDRIWAVVGLHPTHLFDQHIDDDEISYKSRNEEFDPARYGDLARGSKKVVAIGECGLDYYRMPPDIEPEKVKAKQAVTFRGHLDLALELELPVMVHCRDAHDDLADILEEYRRAGKKVRGDIHCFTGTWAEAERYLKLDFYISFTGVITYPPNAAQKAKSETLQDVVKKVPLERMLVETDAPYLAPVPYRGKRNEPAYVRHVAEKIAELKGIPLAEVERQTLKNTCDLFGIVL